MRLLQAFFLKYSEFEDIFSLKLAAELLEHIEIRNNVINLVDGKQPPHKPIYSLRAVELKMLKIYIIIFL